jgi:hypothetical protein
VIATNITAQYDDGRLQPRDPGAVIAWDTVLAHLAAGLQAWLTVVEQGRTPLVRPVLAVLVDERLHVASSPRSRKARSLAAGTTASLAIRTDGLDLVWAGPPTRVTDPVDLDRIAATYRARHGWDVARHGNALDAPYGAPCAGPPPYHAYRIDPESLHAFGTTERWAERSTRWTMTP